MTCRECKHWNVSRGEWDSARVRETATYGRCGELVRNLDIYVKAGWDGGYVDYIDTDHDFFCKYFVREEQ